MSTEMAERVDQLLYELLDVGIRPTSLESKFAWLLVCALNTWLEVGRFAQRSYADLLFHEWKPDESGFMHFIQQLLMEDHSDHPELRDLLTQALIIQAAINCDPAERVVALLLEEAEFRLRHVDDDEDYEDPAETLLWADEWRRMFAAKGWCPSELPDPKGWSDRDITRDRCRACGKLRQEGLVVAVVDPDYGEEERLDDPCIRDLPGVVGACCGHGYTGRSVYVSGLRGGHGAEAARRMRELGGNPPTAAFEAEEAPAT